MWLLPWLRGRWRLSLRDLASAKQLVERGVELTPISLRMVTSAGSIYGFRGI